MATETRIIPPLPITERGFPCSTISSVDASCVYGAGNSVVHHPAGGTPDLVSHHNFKVTAASISPSGSWVASGDARGNVKIWGSRGDRIVKYEYKLITSAIRAIVWSPDSKRIAVCGGEAGRGGEGTCIAFDTGSTLGIFSGHSKPITCVAYRPVAPFRIMTGGEDSSVAFHEGPPFKFMASSKSAHSNFVNAVGFSPDGLKAFSCSSDGTVAVFDGLAGVLLSQLAPKLSCSIWGLAVVGPEMVAVACGDKKVRLVENNAVVSEVVVGTADLRDMPLGISVDSKSGILSAISLDGTVRRYSVQNNALVLEGTTYGSQGSITSILPSKEGVVVSGSDGSVWSLTHPFVTASPEAILCKKPIKAHAGLLMDGDEIIGVSSVKDSHLINVRTGEHVSKLHIPAGTTKLVPSTPIGYAIGEKSTQLIRVDQSSSLVKSKEPISVFAVSVDGSTTVTVHEKARASIALQQEKREIVVNGVKVATELTTADIVAAAVSAGGELIAVASGAQELHVYRKNEAGGYEVVTPTVRAWTYHKGRVGPMRWLDNRFLVTGGLDKAIFLWDLERAAEGPAASMKDAHKEGVSALYGTRDGERVVIVSGGVEGSVKISHITVKI